jgi:hypothetical protein
MTDENSAYPMILAKPNWGQNAAIALARVRFFVVSDVHWRPYPTHPLTRM